MNVIPDTSVWIEYFRGNEEFFHTCQELIEKGEIKTIDLIFAELLQGARNKRESEIIKSYFELIPKVEHPQLYLIAGEYSQKERLFSKGIGLIDACIITAAILSDSKIWTLDKKIKAFMNEKYLY